jgi:hypothetical protein
MALLDAYENYVNDSCATIAKENSTLGKLARSAGFSSVIDGVKGYLDKGIIGSLKNSPLRRMAEDYLVQTIQETTRRAAQNVTGIIESSTFYQGAKSTLTDLRDLAFNAAVMMSTIKNDMVIYFASVIAKEVVKAIKDKRKNLIKLQNAIRDLHNALLVLAGSGKFFNDYLANIRKALLLINDAEIQLAIVQGAFSSRNVFPQINYGKAKTLLDDAYNLLLPPISDEEAKGMDYLSSKTLLKGVVSTKSLTSNISQGAHFLMSIPKLALAMLKAYDLYALQVIKVNVLLLAFQNCVRNLKEVSGIKFKEIIVKSLEKSRGGIIDIIHQMAEKVNGTQDALYGPAMIPIKKVINGEEFVIGEELFVPNPTVTSATVPLWALEIKAARISLELIDDKALQKMNVSANAAKIYNDTVIALEALDNVVSSTAVLQATDGREAVGDIEADLLILAFQANQAIVDSAMTAQQDGRFAPNTVIALGAKMVSRVQLSIDRDHVIEDLMNNFIIKAEPLLKNIRDVGDSIFKLMDDLGMDNASDALRKGAFGDFFAMNGKTATYVGAAVAGLTMTQSLLETQAQKDCLVAAVEKLKVAETSKTLSSNRTVSKNVTRQQVRNTEKCKQLQKEKANVERCSSSISSSDLKSNPGRSLSGLFTGVFGGSVSNPFPGTEDVFPEIKTQTDVINDATASAKKSVDAAVATGTSAKGSGKKLFESSYEQAKNLADTSAEEQLVAKAKKDLLSAQKDIASNENAIQEGNDLFGTGAAEIAQQKGDMDSMFEQLKGVSGNGRITLPG